MHYKINGKYLQVWNGERAVSLGTPDSLVQKILDPDQTKELRDKLTKLIEGEHDAPDQ